MTNSFKKFCRTLTVSSQRRGKTLEKLLQNTPQNVNYSSRDISNMAFLSRVDSIAKKLVGEIKKSTYYSNLVGLDSNFSLMLLSLFTHLKY